MPTTGRASEPPSSHHRRRIDVAATRAVVSSTSPESAMSTIETTPVIRPVGGGVPIKSWTRGVPVEDVAWQQLENTARLPFIFQHVAAMPDVHWGMGATVGSVVATKGAVVPAAVGVDIGCGMMAVRTTLTAEDLPTSLSQLRTAIEKAVPHGRSGNGGRHDRGAWGEVPTTVDHVWGGLADDFEKVVASAPHLKRANHRSHLGTLGTGNHFVEVCLDEAQRVWVMLHSGSRGIGNAIGTIFIERAKLAMRRHQRHLPDENLAWLDEGSPEYAQYLFAVGWAQRFARENRALMMRATLTALQKQKGIPRFTHDELVVNCHHNYVAMETHFGEEVLVTRKGAVRAGAGDWGIIPGSMGAKSFIVRGKGDADSFCSCSHGAGRTMSRGEAKKQITLAEHRAATEGVECRKDKDVLDESPRAYKDIDAVMAAQGDLVEVVHTLKQILCVKG
jgi:tRNA-splicing ligase RtcB